jgi:hypothetical protein
VSLPSPTPITSSERTFENSRPLTINNEAGLLTTTPPVTSPSHSPRTPGVLSPIINLGYLNGLDSNRTDLPQAERTYRDYYQLYGSMLGELPVSPPSPTPRTQSPTSRTSVSTAESRF